MMKDGRAEWHKCDSMKIMVIYFDEEDSSVVRYLKDVAAEIIVYTPDENMPYAGYENIHGNIFNIIEIMRGKVDAIALKKRENYPVGDKFIGNLIDIIKSKGFKVLVIR